MELKEGEIFFLVEWGDGYYVPRYADPPRADQPAEESPGISIAEKESRRPIAQVSALRSKAWRGSGLTTRKGRPNKGP